MLAQPLFNLQSNTLGALCVQGEISYLNAAQAVREAPQAMTGQSTTELDLQGLQRADSATLAVLIAWSAHALAQGTRLHYKNTPPGLLNLARLCGVEQMLGLA